MPRNVEVKARVNDFTKTFITAKSLCDSDAKIINQEDIFFSSSYGRLKLRNFEDGSKSQLIFYKRLDTEDPKLSEYSISVVENPKELVEVLKSALGIIGTVKKTRHFFLYNQTRIHIDQVEDLGDYIEFEVVLSPTQEIKEGEEIANFLIKKFEITQKDLIKGAYIDLLQKNT